MPSTDGKFKLPNWVGQFCPTQLGSSNFLTGWDNFHEIVPDWLEV